MKQSSKRIFARINEIFRIKKTIDETFLDDLEEVLVGTDMGLELAMTMVDTIRKDHMYRSDLSEEDVRDVIRQQVTSILTPIALSDQKRSLASSRVVTLTGVNGSGKTTTAAKLAYLCQRQGRNVAFVAADTFRAAAKEQLGVWADRLGIRMFHQQQGADPASVVFDALKAQHQQPETLLIVDTAGRLQTKKNLMQELSKMARIIDKHVDPSAVTRLLVMDATTGQNGISQAREFDETVSLDGVILTKYDSSAKGGVLIAVARDVQKPIYFVGTGEGLEDLEAFDGDAFVKELF